MIEIGDYFIGDAFQFKVTLNTLLENFSFIAIWVVHEDGTVLQKYSNVEMEDHDNTNIAEVDTYSLRVYGQPEVSINAKPGIYRAEIYKPKISANYPTSGLVKTKEQKIFRMKNIEINELV